MARVHTIEEEILPFDGTLGGFSRFREDVDRICEPGGIPLRLAVTQSSGNRWRCEIDRFESEVGHEPAESVLSFRPRRHERQHTFNVVMLVPTGVDCEVGGHAGDATPAARLLATQCDHLIVHPNIVNASDINEQTDNCLYVEGSIICRLLMGSVALRLVRQNRVLVITEHRADGRWVPDQVVNTASAARATLGVNCVEVLEFSDIPRMDMSYSLSGRSVGEISNLAPLLALLSERRRTYDAVALCTRITPPSDIREIFDRYFQGEGPNPWGGAEAALTHAISTVLNVPAAHAPTLEDLSLRVQDYGQVDPRKAAEAISTSYSFSVLKGLHRAPAVVPNADGLYDPSLLSAEDIACVVIPDGCLGIPTIAALLQEMNVIVVRENTTILKCPLEDLPFAPDRFWVVSNYHEAVGVLASLRAGIHPTAVRRPLRHTQVVRL